MKTAPHPWVEAGVVGLGYAALALTAMHLARQPGSIATVWFADALTVGFLVTATRSRWPGLLLAMAAANLLANLAYGDSLKVAASFTVANLVSVTAAAWLITRYSEVERFLDGPRRYVWIMALGVVLPQVLGASLGASALHWLGFGRFEQVWLDWYVGAALGAVLTLPLVLALRLGDGLAAARALLTPSFAALLLLTIGVALMALPTLPYPFIYVSVPLIAGAFLVPPVASFGLCFVLGVSITAALAFGIFVPPAFLTNWQHVLVYVPALLCVLPAQLLTVGVERDRQLTRTLTALTSVTSELMLYFDLEGKVRAVNNAWLDYHQVTREQVLGQPMAQALTPGGRTDAMRARVRRALAGETVKARVDFTFPKQGRRVTNVTYQPALGADGVRMGVILSVHDVTDLVEAQIELERGMADLQSANEGLEQFARIASHDLREPLNTIVQFTTLIESDHGGELSAPARSHFTHVKQGASRLRIMLDDLLQVVRLERAGQIALRPVELEAAVGDALRALTSRISSRDAKIELGRLPRVAGQDSMVSLLFQNLISNAVKFVPPERQPVVNISARHEGEHVIVTVADNGIGIEAKDLPLLFEPFKRLHSRRKFEGTGLGLTICKRIVRAHDGEISIESTPGQGSQIHVRLRAA